MTAKSTRGTCLLLGDDPVRWGSMVKKPRLSGGLSFPFIGNFWGHRSKELLSWRRYLFCLDDFDSYHIQGFPLPFETRLGQTMVMMKSRRDGTQTQPEVTITSLRKKVPRN